MAESKKSPLKNLYFVGLLISVGVVLLSYSLSLTPLFENIEYKSIDSRFERRGPIPNHGETADVIVVGIDDEAITQLTVGYPYPRIYYAKFIENMNRAGVSVIGVDILFDAVDSKSKENDEALRQILSANQNVILAGRTETESVSGDRYKITTTDTVSLRNIFSDVEGIKIGIIYVPNDKDFVVRRYVIQAMLTSGIQASTFAPAIIQYLKNHEKGREDNPYIIKKEEGFYTIDDIIIPDWDGYTAFLNYYGPAHTFTFISFAHVMDDESIITKSEEENIKNLMEEEGLTYDEVLADNELYDIWAEDLFYEVKDRLKGKIVLIGSAVPEDKDMLPTPFQKGDERQTNNTYGVEIHATAVQNILDGNFLSPLPIGLEILLFFILSYFVFILTSGIKHLKIKNAVIFNLINVVFIFGIFFVGLYLILVQLFGLSINFVSLIYASIDYFSPSHAKELFSGLTLGGMEQLNLLIDGIMVGILTGIFFYFRRKEGIDSALSLEFLNILLLVVVGFGILAFAQYLFEKHLMLVTVVPLISSTGFAYFGSLVYQYFTESKQKQVIKGIFSHYVNKEVVDKMLENPESVRLGGEKLELTVMFSDLSGFTTISEMLSPEGLVDLLNEYLGEMTDILMKNGGTLDKYIGDAIMAFWGAPIIQEDHAIRACRATLLQQEKLAELRAQWIAKGYPKMVARFGINTGQMVVGNMGSASRFNYTVMGDAVNLAARLEPANKVFETYVMISEFTYEKVKDEFLCRQLDLLQVKGKTKPVTVYELMADNKRGHDLSHMENIVKLYNRGLELYYKQCWDDAIATFREVLAIEPEDGPSLTYIHRCEDFKNEPPDTDWDGVYIMKTK